MFSFYQNFCKTFCALLSKKKCTVFLNTAILKIDIFCRDLLMKKVPSLILYIITEDEKANLKTVVASLRSRHFFSILFDPWHCARTHTRLTHFRRRVTRTRTLRGGVGRATRSSLRREPRLRRRRETALGSTLVTMATERAFSSSLLMSLTYRRRATNDSTRDNVAAAKRVALLP